LLDFSRPSRPVIELGRRREGEPLSSGSLAARMSFRMAGILMEPILQEALDTFSAFDLKPFGYPLQDEYVLAWQAMQFLARLVEMAQPQRVIEFGSGRSTVVLAELLHRCGGRLLSFDHKRKFAKRSAGALSERRLNGTANVVHRPLTLRRYGLKVLPAYNIHWDQFRDFNHCQVAFVDGPPGWIGREATVYELFPRTAVGGWIVVDDTNRRPEQRWLEIWRAAFGDALEIAVFPEIGEGVAVLRKLVEARPAYPSAEMILRNCWVKVARSVCLFAGNRGKR
jgi:predicted O-methyltransferase YrrM